MIHPDLMTQLNASRAADLRRLADQRRAVAHARASDRDSAVTGVLVRLLRRFRARHQSEAPSAIDLRATSRSRPRQTDALVVTVHDQGTSAEAAATPPIADLPARTEQLHTLTR
jgi:hypothetical protein